VNRSWKNLEVITLVANFLVICIPRFLCYMGGFRLVLPSEPAFAATSFATSGQEGNTIQDQVYLIVLYVLQYNNLRRIRVE
jgi:hypothetical protein